VKIPPGPEAGAAKLVVVNVELAAVKPFAAVAAASKFVVAVWLLVAAVWLQGWFRFVAAVVGFAAAVASLLLF